jgi:acyl carrier protein
MENDINSIKHLIKGVISDELNLHAQTLTDSTNLRAIPSIESIKILRIIVRVEEHYDIELEDQVVFNVETINDIASAVHKLLVKEDGD